MRPEVLADRPAASFATPARGWLVAPGAGAVVFATRDGGATWARQAVPPSGSPRIRPDGP